MGEPLFFTTHIPATSYSLARRDHADIADEFATVCQALCAAGNVRWYKGGGVRFGAMAMAWIYPGIQGL